MRASLVAAVLRKDARMMPARIAVPGISARVSTRRRSMTSFASRHGKGQLRCQEEGLVDTGGCETRRAKVCGLPAALLCASER